MNTNVRLSPMSDAQYALFCERQVVEYAQQLYKAGEVEETDMLARSQELQRDLLQDLLRDNGHSFLIATSDHNREVGSLWISPRPAFLQSEALGNVCWLSQITVPNELRGHGWGTAIHHVLEAHLRQLGVTELWLRVFDWNTAARSFYRSLGYVTVRQFDKDAHLKKELRSDAPSR